MIPSTLLIPSTYLIFSQVSYIYTAPVNYVLKTRRHAERCLLYAAATGHLRCLWWRSGVVLSWMAGELADIA